MKMRLFWCTILSIGKMTSCGLGRRGKYHDGRNPILEFDDNRVAKITPTSFADQCFDTDKLIITFFPEVMDRLADEGRITLEGTVPGENPFQVYRFSEEDVLITLGQVGCPACAGNLDLFYAMGITKVMFCGGGGVLDKDIEVGRILVVEGGDSG